MTHRTGHAAALLNALREGGEQWSRQLAAATGIPQGSVGPALAKLETTGHVTSRPEPDPHPARRARRYYQITGQATAEQDTE
jgi:transcription initiation factor IIE alpha subunit